MVQEMKNIVYKITFTERKKNNILPYYYIGSKSNCNFVDGKILDKNNNEYIGSSRYKDYKIIAKNSTLDIQILKEFDLYEDALLYECEIQKKYDVVKSLEYFNLSLATQSNFTHPGYGTYRHAEDFNKKIRLKTNDPLILDGTYVGVTKDYKHSNETKEKISNLNSGKNNHFYGKSHTNETKEKISKINKGRIVSDETKKKMSNTRKGVLKSADHKSKIGRKGYIMLKNINDGKSIRILKEDNINYDLNVWVNPAKYAKIYREKNS